MTWRYWRLVEVSLLDVAPLAVQGPTACDVVAAIFGDWADELRYFWFREALPTHDPARPRCAVVTDLPFIAPARRAEPPPRER